MPEASITWMVHDAVFDSQCGRQEKLTREWPFGTMNSCAAPVPVVERPLWPTCMAYAPWSDWRVIETAPVVYQASSEPVSKSPLWIPPPQTFEVVVSLPGAGAPARETQTETYAARIDALRVGGRSPCTRPREQKYATRHQECVTRARYRAGVSPVTLRNSAAKWDADEQIGRASCRER